jgi:uncharacterized membrane protein YccC
VVELALTLAMAVAVAAWLGIGTYAVLTDSVATTAMFSADASTQATLGANLWHVGAVFLLIGALVGLGVVALLVGRRQTRPKPVRGPPAGQQVVPHRRQDVVGTSSDRRPVTRRLISSRMRRTDSTPLPAGSSRSQSSYRLPG